MSKTLLVVHHAPSPATREVLEAVLARANAPEIDAVPDAQVYLFGTGAQAIICEISVY